MISDELAKATQEVAKTVGQGIEASKTLAKFFKDVFGDLVIDGAGLASDKLKYYRIERAIALHDKTTRNLNSKGITNFNAVAPKIGIPLIESATIEDNDDIQALWANMLANAMNPNFDGKIERKYISILQDMSLTDVKIFNYVMSMYLREKSDKLHTQLMKKEALQTALNIELETVDACLRNLLRLGCIKQGHQYMSAIKMEGTFPSVYFDIEQFGITTLGLDFYKSISTLSQSTQP
jgi:hypothetical protein